jgi:hypothetical protein
MIDSPSQWYVVDMTRSSSGLLALALGFQLAACLDESADLCVGCDDPLEVTGTATFLGETHDFDDAFAEIRMAGTVDDPCIDYVHVIGKSETGNLAVVLSPTGVDGDFEVVAAGFGEYSSEDYGVYNEDVSEFSATFELEDHDQTRARASLHVTATNVRAYLSASEDWGPYYLTNVDLSVSGGWSVEWTDACD